MRLGINLKKVPKKVINLTCQVFPVQWTYRTVVHLSLMNLSDLSMIYVSLLVPNGHWPWLYGRTTCMQSISM